MTTLAHGLAASAAAAAAAGTPATSSLCQICKQGAAKVGGRTLWPVQLTCGVCEQTGTWHVSCLLEQRALLSPADRAALCPYHVSANCTCHDAPASSGDCERCFRRWCHADPFPAPDTALSMLREDTPPATPRDMSDTSSSTSASTSTPTSTSSRPAHATTSPLLGSSSASVAHDPLMFGPSSVVMLGDAFMHGERSAVTTPSRSRPVSVHEGPSPARFYDTSVGMLTSPAQGHSTSSMSAHSLDMMTMSSRSTPDMSHVVADLHDAPSLQISGAAPISVGNEGLLMSEVEPLAPAISSLHADETSSPFRFGAATAIMPLHLRDDDAMERVILPAARMVKLDSSGSPSEEDTDVPMLISPFMTGKPSAKSKADHHASPRRKRSKSRSASRSSSVGASSRCPPLPVGDAKGSMKLRLLKYGAKAPPAKGSKKKKKGKTTRRKTKKSRRKPKPVKIAPDATAAEILAALLPSGVADAAEPYIIVSAEPSPHDHLVDLEYPLFPLTRSKAKRETMAQNPRAQIKTRAAFSFLDKGELTEQEAEWAVWANEGVRCSASSKGVLTSVSRNLPLLHNGTSNSISLDGAAPQPPQPVTAPSSQVIVKASPSATRNGRESRSFAGLCLYLEPRALYDPTFLAKVTASPVSATAAKSRKPPASSASAPARGRRSGTSNSAYYNYSSSYRGPSSIPMPPPPLAQTLPPSSAAAKAAASARLSAPPEEYVPPLKPPPTLAEQQAELRRRAAAAAAAGPPPSGYYYRGQYYPYSSAGPGQRCKCAECIRLYGPEGAPASSSYVRYSSYRTPDGRIVYTPYNSSSPYYAGKPGSPPSGAPVKREGGARYPSQQAPSSSASASSSSSSRRPPATKPTKGSTARKSSAASASRSRAPTPTPPPLRKTFLAGRSSDTVSSALVPAGSKSPSKRALPHLILVLTWQMRCVFVELPVEMQAMAQRELAHGAVVWIKGAVVDAPPVTLRDPRLPPSATGRQQVFGCGALEVHLQQGLSSKTTFPCIRPVHASSIAFVRPNTRLARAFLAFTHDELLRLNAPPGEKKKRKKRKRSVTTTVTPPPAAVSLSSDDLPDEHTPLIRMSTAAKRSSARRDSDSISLRGLPDRASKRLRIVMPRAVEENDGDSDVEMVSESLPSGRGSGRGRAKNNVNDQDHGDVMMAPDDVSVRRSGRRRRPSQRAAATRTSMDGSSSRSRGQRGTGSGSEIVVNVSTHLHHHHHHHHHGTTTSTNALSSMSVPPELLRGLNSSVLGGDDALPSLDPLAMGLDGIDTLGSLGPLSLGALVDPIDMDDEGFEHLSASPETPLDDIDSFMMDGDDDVTKPQTLASLAQSPPTDADESVSLLHHPTPDDDADADGARARKRPRKSPTTSTTSKAAKAAKAAKTAHYIHHHLHHHHHHHPSSKLGGGNIQWVVCDSPSCRKWRALAANVPPPLKNFYCGRLEEPDADECARLDDWIVHCVGKPKATELASLGIETVEHLNNKTKLLDGVGVRYNDKTQVLSVC